MDTVIVKNSQFYSHCQKRIAKGTVNAEHVEIRLDSEWDGLTARIHWLNVASGVEITPMLERDKPNTIPWEVLTDLGELRMGLVGMDGDTVIKPTIWITYGYVSDGVDPESGSDPQPPTPSWEQQMVEQATQANQAAQAAQQAAEEAVKAVASAGPYAEQAKQSAEAAKASQDAAATSAQRANEAAQTAQNAAGSIGDAVKRAEDAATAAGTAQQAAEAAQGAATRSAETAQGSATTANQAAQESNSAATKAGQYLTSVESAAKAADSARDQATTAATTAQGAAQAAASARDQATTAATTAQDHATAARTAKDAAEQAAATAGSAQSGAAQSAQTAASSASAAQAAQQAAEAAAAVLPPLTEDVANKFLAADSEGKKLVFIDKPGGGADVWKDIGTVPLSPDVSLYELAGVDDFRQIRLIILREYNAELTGSMSARILTSKGVLSSILGNFSSGGRAMCNVSVGVDNLGVTGGEVYSVNNLLNTAAPAEFISKGPGFGGSANYNRLNGDKYVLYASQPETCFDGAETAMLQGVPR